jgi:competence protein ComEC
VKQPLVAIALLYGAGVVLGYLLEAPLAAAFLTAFVLTLLALSVNQWRVWLLPAILLLFGWLNMTTRTALVSPYDLRSLLDQRPAIVAVRGRIEQEPSQRIVLRNGVERSHTLAVVAVDAVKLQSGVWQPAFGQVMSRTTGVLPQEFVEGQNVEINGVAARPLPPVADGLFDYGRYLNLRGIYYELKVDSIDDWKPAGALIPAPISERFRTWAQRTLARGLPTPDESLRLQWAMLLGWQTALTAEVSEPFMHSGTMHIFAISGLHIVLIAMIFRVLFRAVMVPRFASSAIVIAIIWFYTGATGWQASAIRSTVMMTVILFGGMLSRPINTLNSLAVAACIILVWQPEQLFQASFQLSFFVVLSLALLAPPIEKLKQRVFKLDPFLPMDLRPWWQHHALRMGAKAWTGVATSMAAFIGSAPLIAHYFHLFTPGSLVANLLVIPVSTLALASGLGSLVTGDVLPFATEWFNNGGWICMRAMVWLSHRTAEIPGAWWHVRAPSPLFFFFYYGLLLMLCAGWFSKRLLRWTALAYALGLTALLTFQWQRERAWHQLTVLPLHDAHAVYVEPAGNGKEWLINTGDHGAAEFVLKPFLQARGEDWIENLLLTQGDVRFAGGTLRLNETFPIREAFASPVVTRSPRYRELLSALETKAHLHRSVTNGFTAQPWRILHPNASDRFASAADNAVVALGTFDHVSVLMIANPSFTALKALFTRHPDLHADVLITGLPEVDGSLPQDWIKAIAPKLIVLANSETPTHSASPALLQRLRRTGAEIVSTQNGAVTISVRDRQWRVRLAHTQRDSELE